MIKILNSNKHVANFIVCIDDDWETNPSEMIIPLEFAKYTRSKRKTILVVFSSDLSNYYVVNQSMLDLTRQILENPLSFHYSQLTGELKFMGDTPRSDVILEVYETIPDCALYSDEIFFRYCSAKIKQSLGAKLGIFKFAMPGNVEFDYDAIKSMGDEELAEIIEEIKGDEGVDWMFHS